MDKRLKIGLLVDDPTIPLWAAEIVRKLEADNCAEVTLVVQNMLPGEPSQLRDSAHAPEGSLKATLLKIRRNASKLGFIAFSMLDSTFKPHSRSFDKPRDIAELLPNVPVIEVTPIKSLHSDTIVGNDLKNIRNADVDILFRIGFRILRGGILQASRYGVWSYHHGDNLAMRGGPSGFWELSSGAPVVGVVLQILNEDLDGGQILTRSWHLPDIILLNRQRQNVFMQALSHFPRQVKRLATIGPDEFFEEVAKRNQHPCFYSKRLFVAPNNRLAILTVGRLYLRYLCDKLINLVTFRQWVLLTHFDHKVDSGLATSMWRYKQLVPPRDRCWADPFVIERGGKFYAFVEELIFKKGRGHISVIELGTDGSFKDSIPVIEKPYHLSYPFLLEHQGELYMIPESGDSGNVDVYRCTDFPEKWELEKTLMTDVFAVDATLKEHNGRWWMFVTIRENEGTNCLDELHVYHADSPLSSDWQAHPLNPVSSDVRNARPAGSLFEHEGNLYRPAQNGSVRYGYGIHINHIEVLSETDYRETCISSIKPDWDMTLNATHTINHHSGFSVSDGSKLRFRYFKNVLRGKTKIL